MAIRVRGLRRSYGELRAVDGIDLEVGEAEVFAFLGPNGAGKTTTVEILEGYRSRDGGEVEVLGQDPARPTREWRARIGLVLQESEPQRNLTVRETLELYAGYYPSPRPVAETIERVGLEDRAGARAGSLSGGERRRLDVAAALVGDPDLLFLDEPTTGFDPAARRAAWETIGGLRDLGKTVFLTTHYMEEAQALADRVAIVSRGRIVAEGSPAELAAGGRRARVSFRLAGADPAELPGPFAAGADGDRVSVELADPLPALGELERWTAARGARVSELEVRRPGLEEVYLELTREDGER